ncbi:hypothetical protein HUG10_02970 [Halorarum halophilum]|uniref:Uncharacterized protein n=1 Tax=Halorarum halophilum TaxID=2743090 RepID=A0A7D5K069_9EURY|nr:hypothetical protein [Halobaculum halophilum]QLG26561.1 hypothetical protein HUG10_02970 [Halobaculum halophilum]
MPADTPLADLRDTGYDVLAVGVFPEELPACPAAGAYPACEHVVLRSPKPG